jgi:hypothetical protein
MLDILILLISDLLDLGFNAKVVFGLGKDFLFKSILGRCEGGKNSFIPVLHFHDFHHVQINFILSL